MLDRSKPNLLAASMATALTDTKTNLNKLARLEVAQDTVDAVSGQGSFEVNPGLSPYCTLPDHIREVYGWFPREGIDSVNAITQVQMLLLNGGLQGYLFNGSDASHYIRINNQGQLFTAYAGEPAGLGGARYAGDIAWPDRMGGIFSGMRSGRLISQTFHGSAINGQFLESGAWGSSGISGALVSLARQRVIQFFNTTGGVSGTLYDTSVWKTLGPFSMRWLMQAGSAAEIEYGRLFAGLTNDPAVATGPVSKVYPTGLGPLKSIMFIAPGGAGSVWTTYCANGTNYAVKATSRTVLPYTLYALEIRRETYNGDVQFFIDGDLVATHSTDATGYAPVASGGSGEVDTANFYECFQIDDLGSGARYWSSSHIIVQRGGGNP